MTKTLTQLLAEHEFLGDLDPAFLDLLAEHARAVRVPAGGRIFTEGDPADTCWLVVEGRAALELGATGRGVAVLATVGPGQLLGWSWLFPPFRWHFDARAVTEVLAVVLDGPAVRDRCEADPRFGYELMKRFTELSIHRLQATRLQLLDVYGSEIHDLRGSVD